MWLIWYFKLWRLRTVRAVSKTFVESEMELFVRLLNSFKTLNIVTSISVLDIFEVLHLPLSLNLLIRSFNLITKAKLLSVKFVFMLVGQRNCTFFLIFFFFSTFCIFILRLHVNLLYFLFTYFWNRIKT